MRRDLKKQSWTLALAAAFGLAASTPAAAEETCSLRGSAILPKGSALYDSASGASELATFTGGTVPLTVVALPDTAAAGGRAQIVTAGFRLKGFVRAKDIPVFTARTVPVHAGHVWIAEGRKVSIIGASGGRVHVERSVTFPMSGSFHGWAPCDSLSLSQKVGVGFTPGDGMRGYVAKKERVELMSAPRGDVVVAIEPSAENGVLLWGSDRSGNWIHVEHHGDVILDGWVRMQDVSALPPGETMDQQVPPITLPGSPKLQLQGNAKTVTTASEVPLRARGSEASPLIGAIEAGTEVLVLDVVAGWASVVPKSLMVMPPANASFYARAKDLGI